MRHECGACGGTGQCRNDHHSFFQLGAAAVEVLTGSQEEGGLQPCPACGQGYSNPGNCSTCGGSGWQEDD